MDSTIFHSPPIGCYTCFDSMEDALTFCTIHDSLLDTMRGMGYDAVGMWEVERKAKEKPHTLCGPALCISGYTGKPSDTAWRIVDMFKRSKGGTLFKAYSRTVGGLHFTTTPPTGTVFTRAVKPVRRAWKVE